ncbi:MAG: DUF2970 domain-containing protein [Burkholderiales bacterium]
MWWNTFKAVVWAFLGIRSSRGYEEDRSKLKIQHVVIVGVVCALIFVAMLFMLVKFITAK